MLKYWLKGVIMKRKVAKEILVDSFFELAETVPVGKIKIKDITENCSYSPATFYRQFRDKADLILWAYQRDFEEITKKFGKAEENFEDLVLSFVMYFKEKKEYYSDILNSEKADELFIKPMYNFHFDLMKNHCQEKSDKKLSIETEMLLRAYSVGALSIIFDWLMGLWDTTPEEIAYTCIKAIPPDIIGISEKY